MAGIQHILDEITADPAAARARLRWREASRLLVDALRAAAAPNVRQVLCSVLGQRREASAVDALVACLADPEPATRIAAAEALGTIGDRRAGEALLQRFEMPDPSLHVRRALIVALGAVGHRAAVPTLSPAQKGLAQKILDGLDGETGAPTVRGRAIEADPHSPSGYREVPIPGVGRKY